MIRRISVSMLFACFCIGLLNVPSFGDGGKAGNVEELLFMEIPSVLAASRREQSVTDAPASVEVITAEEIKQCGATTIPEALRMLTGINLITVNSRNSIVNVRGFSEQQGANETVLAMIDGRPMTWDVYDIVLWDRQSVSLDEIERIEVVKGPGSSLYGANAYAGIINIITKTPEQINGTQVNIQGGSPKLWNTSVITGGTGKKVDYKLSAAFSSQDEYKDTAVNNAGQISMANALVDYKFSDDSKLSFSAGRSYALDDKNSFGSTLGIGVNPTGDTNDYSQVSYTLGNLSIRSCLKDSYMNILFPVSSSPWYFRVTSNDTELQHSINIQEKHTLVWGITSKTIEMKQSEITTGDIYQAIWAVFAEDQFKATDKLSVVLGARYDKNTLMEGRISPRGGILYTIKDGHIVMLSATQAPLKKNFLMKYSL
jgi:iron complex outermembrane receptor protein